MLASRMFLKSTGTKNLDNFTIDIGPGNKVSENIMIVYCTTSFEKHIR